MVNTQFRESSLKFDHVDSLPKYISVYVYDTFIYQPISNPVMMLDSPGL